MNRCYLLLVSLSVISWANGDWFFNLGSWRMFSRSCPDESKSHDSVKNLQKLLEERVIGQPIVKKVLLGIVGSHLTGNPPKALTICMHGPTGTGKSMVSSLIAESIYERGLKDENVHFFTGRYHFPLATPEAIAEYKTNLNRWISGNVSICERSLFIFDEIDKTPSQLIETISPFVDHHSVIDRIDYRKSIFIFISNVGSSSIVKRYVELWESGFTRNEIEYNHFEQTLRMIAYNAEGAFEKSHLLENHLVDLYLPFLPLERSHVKECIYREMKIQNVFPTEENVNSVLDAMDFHNYRFSVSGCRRVYDQVALLRYDKDEL